MNRDKAVVVIWVKLQVAGTEKFLSVCTLGVVPVILGGSEGSKLHGVLIAPGYIFFFLHLHLKTCSNGIGISGGNVYLGVCA